MPGGRPPKLTPAVEKQIAELFWLAFTDEQVALFTDLSSKTIQRMRAGELCPAIKKAEIGREIAYRKRIWAGIGNWCGASWFLERKYPTQFAKPEIQLGVNMSSNVTHNTLIVTAEVAREIGDRAKAAEAKIEKLIKDKRGNGEKAQ